MTNRTTSALDVLSVRSTHFENAEGQRAKECECAASRSVSHWNISPIPLTWSDSEEAEIMFEVYDDDDP